MEVFKIYITHFDFIISHKKSIKIFEPENDIKSNSGMNPRVDYRKMMVANEKARSVLHLSGNKDWGRKIFLQQHPEGFNVTKEEWLLEGVCQGGQQKMLQEEAEEVGWFDLNSGSPWMHC